MRCGKCGRELGAYLILCIISVVLIPASSAGLFGLESDPLSGIFAFILGLPWTLLLGNPADDSGWLYNLILILLAMLLNGGLLALFCRWLSKANGR
jgi:hypothetical protein